MSAKKVFCEECRNDVNFVVTSVQMVGTIKDKAYHYVGKAVHCADCGSELFAPKFSDFNLRALYDVFRKKTVSSPLHRFGKYRRNMQSENGLFLYFSDGGSKLFPDTRMAIYQRNNTPILFCVYTTILHFTLNCWKLAKES